MNVIPSIKACAPLTVAPSFSEIWGNLYSGTKRAYEKRILPPMITRAPITMFTPTLKVSVVFRSTSRSLHSLDRFFRVGESVRASTRAALTRARSLNTWVYSERNAVKKLTSLMPSSNGLCGKRISLERLLSRRKHPDFSFKVPRCP